MSTKTISRRCVGDRAQIELNAYPNASLADAITNIGKLLDPATRSAKVRIELSNERGLLRPNMFATVHFQSQGSQCERWCQRTRYCACRIVIGCS